MSSVNDNTKPLFGFLNDARISDLEGVLASDFVKNSDLDTKVGNENYIKIGSVNTALESYYTKEQTDGKYAVPADIPDISGKQDSGLALETAVDGFGFLKEAGVLGAVDNDGYLKQAGVLSAVQADGYIKSDALEPYYTKTQSDAKYAVPADIPSVVGFLTSADISGKQDIATLDADVEAAGYQKASGVLSVVSAGGYLRATDSAITNKLRISNLDTEIVALNKYATKTEVALKQDVSDMSNYALGADMATALDAKTSKTYVDTELALKQDKSSMSSYALGSDMATALSNKANDSRVSSLKSALITMLDNLISGSSPALATVYSDAKTAINAI